MIERAVEVRDIARAMAAGRAGAGRTVLIEGPPGIGKSTLIEVACHEADAMGLKVLRACGGELEQRFPFGVARQLLERVVHPADGRGGTGLLTGPARFAAGLLGADDGTDANLPAGPDGAHVAVHALWWVIANLARVQPVAIVVDDAQWVDLASLRLLTYTTRRIADTPLVIVVGARRANDIEPLSTVLLGTGDAALLRPAVLSASGSAELVRRLDPTATDDRCGTCHAASGGNPFLLSELAGDVERTAAAGDVAVPQRLSGHVLTRIGQGPPGSLPLARAVAVLGLMVPLRHAAVVAGLDLEEAGHAADALSDGAVLRHGRPLAFRHPILAAAVAEDIPPSERATAHLRAAHLLAGEDGASERIGAHLLAAEPRGDPWSCEWLRVATAREAIGHGAPDAAVRYLRRALVEPPPHDARVDVLLELGAAEALDQDFAPTIDHLRRGIGRLGDYPTPGLGDPPALGRPLPLRSVRRDGVDAGAGAARLRAQRLQSRRQSGSRLGERDARCRGGARRRMADRIERLVARVLSGDVTAPPTLAAAAAEPRSINGVNAELTADLARRALAAVDTGRDRFESWPAVTLRSMTIAGHPAVARRTLDHRITHARHEGSLQELRALLPLRAEVATRSGDLRLAETDLTRRSTSWTSRRAGRWASRSPSPP